MKNIETYFSNSAYGISDKIQKRIERMYDNIKQQHTSKHSKLHEIESCRDTLVYIRDVYIKTHFQLLAANKIPNTHPSFQILEFYYEGLQNIEQAGMITIMRIIKPWFGISKKRQQEMNDQLIDLLNDL